MLTYKRSGVDRDSVYSLTKRVSEKWGFAATYDLAAELKKYRNPVLISSTDGVGTKVWLAVEHVKLGGIGQDLVAMNVNDIATYGARPLYFMDYFSTSKLSPKVFKAVIDGVRRSCRECGMELAGGETAIHPQNSAGSSGARPDLAGFVVGIAERGKLLGSHRVRNGDVLIGVSSNGVHSNGFSLIRKAIELRLIDPSDRLDGWRVMDILLRPTHLYSNLVLELVSKVGEDLRACANITGGAFKKNIPRSLPPGLRAVIYYGSWRIQPIFDYLKKRCKIPLAEMVSTFNLGVGFVLIVSRRSIDAVERVVERAGYESWVIGRVERRVGREPVNFVF